MVSIRYNKNGESSLISNGSFVDRSHVKIEHDSGSENEDGESGAVMMFANKKTTPATATAAAGDAN